MARKNVKRIEEEWELMDANIVEQRLWRLRVPHGWLVRYSTEKGDSICFYEDVQHFWPPSYPEIK